MTASGTYQPVTFSPGLIDQVGSIGKVLSTFLDSEKHTIQHELNEQYPNSAGNAVHLVLNAFVTVDGTKRPLRLDEINIREVNSEQLIFIIQRLERARILRLDDDTYELAHDTLAKHIHSQRSAEELGLLEAAGVVKNRWADYEKTGTLMNAKEVALVSSYLGTLEERALLSPEEVDFVRRSIADVNRKRLARRLTVAVVMTAMLGLTIWALIARADAKTQEAIAQTNAEIAQQNLEQALLARAEADQAKYDELLEQGVTQMRKNPPDYEAALDFFIAAQLIAEDTSRGDFPFQTAYDGQDAEFKGLNVSQLKQYASSREGKEAQFDSLMNAGIRLQDQGYEYWLDALATYRRALEMDYNDTRAEVSIDLLVDKIPMAFERLRQEGDIYFDASNIDGRGYADALRKYQEAKRMLPWTNIHPDDRQQIDERIRICREKTGMPDG